MRHAFFKKQEHPLDAVTYQFEWPANETEVFFDVWGCQLAGVDYRKLKVGSRFTASFVPVLVVEGDLIGFVCRLDTPRNRFYVGLRQLHNVLFSIYIRLLLTLHVWGLAIREHHNGLTGHITWRNIKLVKWLRQYKPV